MFVHHVLSSVRRSTRWARRAPRFILGYARYVLLSSRYRRKWYHFAIINHDFLLGAMIVCLDLMNIRIKTQSAKHTLESHDSFVTEKEQLNAVENSRAICEVMDDC